MLNNPKIQHWQQKFHTLPKRDKFALTVLAIFLILFVFGYSGWLLHEKANKSQKSYDETMSNIFWLRSQANNIQTSSNQNNNKIDSVRQILAQSGINGQVLENGNQIQLNFSHSQSAVINNVFNQVHQQGMIIQQLHINQPNLDNLEVQATVILP